MLKKSTSRLKYVLLFLVTGKYHGRTEEVVSLAMMMSKMAACNTVPPFLTHTFDEVSVLSLDIPYSQVIVRGLEYILGLLFGNS